MNRTIVLLYLIFLECAHALPATKDCNTLPTVHNADILEESVKDSYRESDIIHFSCRPGHVQRKITYVCLRNRWKLNSHGECTLKPCELPEDIAHGRYEIIEGSDFVFGTTIKYFCNEGYQMVGREDTRTCLLAGWNNRAPQCEELHCSADMTTNSLIVSGWLDSGHMTAGHVLHFRCAAAGMTLKGASQVVCLSSGLWSRPFPTCEASTPAPVGRPVGSTFCGPPPQVRYADIEGFQRNSYRSGERVRFKCQNLYTIHGPEFMQCNQGRWGSGPTCLKPCTVTVEDMNERKIVLRYSNMQKMYARHSEPIQFACEYGRSQVDDTPFRQYCDDGKMTLPVCQ